MSGGGGEGEEGAAAGVPAASQMELVRSLTAMLDLPEDEVYDALCACGMDAGEAVDRLLAAGTFEEVKRKKHRNKNKEQSVYSLLETGKKSNCGQKTQNSLTGRYRNASGGHSSGSGGHFPGSFASYSSTNGSLSATATPVYSTSGSFRDQLQIQKTIDPFDGQTYCLERMFHEYNDESQESEQTIAYARYCSARAHVRLLNKDKDICFVCYFKYNQLFPIPKEKIKEHVSIKHHIDGFLCPSRGCLVRSSTLSEIGLHFLYCHEQKKEWWITFVTE